MEKIPFTIKLSVANGVNLKSLSKTERTILISQECAIHLNSLFQILDLVTWYQADSNQETEIDNFQLMTMLNSISRLGNSISDTLLKTLEELQDLQNKGVKKAN